MNNILFYLEKKDRFPDVWLSDASNNGTWIHSLLVFVGGVVVVNA